MKKFIEFFKSKGALATILGITFGTAVDTVVFFRLLRQYKFSEFELTLIIALNLLAMGWVILPSIILIKAKVFEFRIED
jgi:hypothetical protein